MTRTPREHDDRDKTSTTAKRRTLPDADGTDGDQSGDQSGGDQSGGDEIPQAGLPTEDVELDTRPRR